MAANTASMGMNIGELAEQRGVRECLQWFTREKQWINEAHLQLCRVPAPTFLEQERARWFLEQLRAAGWDGVVIRGKAASPVYLWIKDDKVEFRDATAYWGKLTGEVQDGIEAELGDKRVRTLQCGVAGERGVRFAAIVNQLKHFHGRGGLGAVMGSKKLKAIVVREVLRFLHQRERFRCGTDRRGDDRCPWLPVVLAAAGTVADP